jgi:single-strand DNA-binding protein
MNVQGAIPFTAAGNLTEDPRLRFTGTGKPIASVRVAVTPRQFDRDTGGFVDGTTTFVDGSVWGAQAERVVESLRRGDRVVVVGRWVTRVFTPDRGPNEGRQLRRLEVMVEEIGPSLLFATATVTRTGTGKPPDPDPDTDADAGSGFDADPDADSVGADAAGVA